jgi:hypothetical protein
MAFGTGVLVVICNTHMFMGFHGTKGRILEIIRVPVRRLAEMTVIT